MFWRKRKEFEDTVVRELAKARDKFTELHHKIREVQKNSMEQMTMRYRSVNIKVSAHEQRLVELEKFVAQMKEAEDRLEDEPDMDLENL